MLFRSGGGLGWVGSGNLENLIQYICNALSREAQQSFIFLIGTILLCFATTTSLSFFFKKNNNEAKHWMLKINQEYPRGLVYFPLLEVNFF